MTSFGPRREAPSAPLSPDAAAASRASAICPYIRTSAGWRSAAASREHRCTAVAPPARLSGDKQSRLCLVAAHAECPTFIAAREARAARGVPPLADRRPLARTTPTILEPARARFGLSLGGNARRIGQGGVAVLMLVALVAVVLARTGPSQGGDGGALQPSEPVATMAIGTSGGGAEPSGSPSIPASAAAASPSAASSSPAATKKPAATPVPTRVPATPAPTPASTPARTATPTPAASGSYVSYTVKSGDTLSAIAAKYQTTVQAILDANGIRATDYLRIGQVLRIPR
jgi:LysM repeat protein